MYTCMYMYMYMHASIHYTSTEAQSLHRMAMNIIIQSAAACIMLALLVGHKDALSALISKL